MLRALTVQHNLISVEALTPGAVYGAVTNLFPQFIDGVKSFANGLLAPSNPPMAKLVDIKLIEKKLGIANYVQLSPTSAFVPVGLSVTYLDYLEVLSKCIDIVEHIDDEVIQPFTTWISALLTNPSMLNSLRATPNIPGVKFHDIEATRKELGKCFNKGSATEQDYGKVVKRNADFILAAKTANQLTERMSRIDRAQIMSNLEALVGLVNRLIENVRAEPDQYKVSSGTLDAMSKLTYQVAQEIEYYSIVAYQLQALTIAMEDTTDKLNRILNS